jgi:hypothetical protein
VSAYHLGVRRRFSEGVMGGMMVERNSTPAWIRPKELFDLPRHPVGTSSPSSFLGEGEEETRSEFGAEALMQSKILSDKNIFLVLPRCSLGKRT